MYVTRPLSDYIKSPETLSVQPEGPNSGILVIQDVESETYNCFGLCKNKYLLTLPFPQNKNLTVRYSSSNGQHTTVNDDEVAFIPVLNQPLSANRYYAIKSRGSHKGEAYSSSGEEDMATCCFCRCIKDLKPTPFNSQDTSQQFEIVTYETMCQSSGAFFAKSVVPDRFPPQFLRRKGWEIYGKTPKNYELGEASGINSPLRAKLPEFDFPLSFKKSEAVTVGRWYSPFVFIKEGALRDQMKSSMFYEITLEQTWEQIFSCENDSNNNDVNFDVVVKKEVAFIEEREAVWNERNVVDGKIWFTNGTVGSLGLSVEIFERMKWEEERVGWVGGEKRQERVKKEEGFGGNGGWTQFGCYILVERFVVKRMDASLLMTYEFKHTHQIRPKWE